MYNLQICGTQNDQIFFLNLPLRCQCHMAFVVSRLNSKCTRLRHSARGETSLVTRAEACEAADRKLRNWKESGWLKCKTVAKNATKNKKKQSYTVGEVSRWTRLVRCGRVTMLYSYLDFLSALSNFIQRAYYQRWRETSASS